MVEYTIREHKHRFAVWCAASAYGRGLEGGGNTLAKSLIEAVGLDQVQGPGDIGADVDEWLMGYMRQMVAVAKTQANDQFTFGHAQKLVNIYLKSLIVCGGHHQEAAVGKLHPPLDSVLLNGLRRHLFKNRGSLKPVRAAFLEAQRASRSWTAFDEGHYRQHIGVIKMVVGAEPLFTAEKHWQI